MTNTTRTLNSAPTQPPRPHSVSTIAHQGAVTRGDVVNMKLVALALTFAMVLTAVSITIAATA
ncbi:hypothetical protein [Williamsia sterculiae]|uniref:Uncharacterized protein n=1 Tax=Williamsia sterculiae TaxID=1344003 RepID=A0A1N7FXD4_9NOCA|nr:hypothetical protein [Williamsia sterculiae]SIS04992.1 hypothetical protein SAMN05445060_2376 [Williamsia sterculiae]